jgi:excisionase family DNA binding protein
MRVFREVTEMEQQLLKVESAARLLNVSHWAIRAWAKQKRITSVKLGRLLMIPASEVTRLVQEGMRAAAK